MSDAPFLSPPDMRYKDSFIAAAHEYLADGIRPDWSFERLEDSFDEYVEVQRERATDPMPGYVPDSVFWLIVDGQYAGTLYLRHYLTPSLERYGGHIGYQVRPTMRRRGYGTLMCRLGLEEARKIGLDRVLITCDDNNIGSIKIIEANGGVLQDKVDNGRAALTRRYWVDL